MKPVLVFLIFNLFATSVFAAWDCRGRGSHPYEGTLTIFGYPEKYQIEYFIRNYNVRERATYEVEKIVPDNLSQIFYLALSPYYPSSPNMPQSLQLVRHIDGKYAIENLNGLEFNYDGCFMIRPCGKRLDPSAVIKNCI